MKSLKIFILFITVAIYQTNSFAQTVKWGYDASHAKVSFSISHFGISETEGKFTKFDGIVLSDKPDFSDAKFNFIIDVSSINTEDAKRDKHLKSADFFDIEKYPSITFKSKTFKSVGKNKYKLTGLLTMHGVTKPITLDVIYKGTVIDPYKNTKAGFKISGVLDRTAFGLVWNGNLSTGELLVGNEVTLDINIELIKK
ncbi:MAG TPA: polyisoprenoid-binding protein [Flavobacteriia bacterium]|jgi:polyisoprenoid-binding protein YceI|nr:polyisoprenoid-binding protein [Flavobacteriia bacterium]